MNIELELKTKLKDALKSLGQEVELSSIVIEHSKNKEHGDYASNVAMQMARNMHKAPKMIAEDIVNVINMDGVDKIEIAGPGFLNFFMKSSSLSSGIKNIIELGDNYGRANSNGKRINVEFVSANPTGNLHLGHARCAAIGDSICRLYDWAGYDVTREYYINDAGVQIAHLRDSIRARYLSLLGIPTEVPSDGYLGLDIIEVAKKMIEQVGDKYIKDSKESMEYFTNEGMRLELEQIKKDLSLYRVEFDVYSSELKVRSNNAVEKTLEEYKDYIYEQDGAKFLRTTAFLDDKDRAIVKSDGQYTYFTPDITYHLNKLSRNYDYLIDILGADHHGYINRMKSALMMKGYSADTLEIELVQVVRLMKNGEEVKMSKRTGNAITLRELCEEVGVDAARYFFVDRGASSHLDFAYDLARQQNSSNPVYYAQYAHARLSKIFEKCDIEPDINGTNLKEKPEMDLLKHLFEFPNLVLSAAKERAPQKVTQYIQTLASLIHGFYTECRVISEDNIEVTKSRLALALASKITLKNALSIIGVSAPTSM